MDVNMDWRRGTKWFTFFAKVRPWFACVAVLASIMDYSQYSYLYSRYWWLMLNFCISLASPALNIVLFVKSRGNYIKFVRFVRGFLIFECLSFAYNQAVDEYISTLFNASSAFGVFIFALAVDFLVWYWLNMRYFKKRIYKPTNCNQDNLTNVQDMVVASGIVKIDESSKVVLYCRKCGNKLLADAAFCTKCGTKIVKE